jgi:large subunit ribosomal protein L9
MSRVRAAAGVIRRGNMRVILKQDVENLGRKGDIVNVTPGYGRNYLVPRRLALEVTSSNLKMIEIERQALKKKIEKERLSYEELIRKLNELRLTFSRKAGEKDLIFGSVSAGDIKEALDKLGFDIEKRKIILEEPIKRLGNYTIPVKVFQDDKADLKIEVQKEEGQEEADESGKKEEEGKEKK